MPDFFQTERSGQTVHTATRSRVDLTALCGVTTENTDWTRQVTAIAPDERDCPRCRAERRRGR